MSPNQLWVQGIATPSVHMEADEIKGTETRGDGNRYFPDDRHKAQTNIMLPVHTDVVVVPILHVRWVVAMRTKALHNIQTPQTTHTHMHTTHTHTTNTTCTHTHMHTDSL